MEATRCQQLKMPSYEWSWYALQGLHVVVNVKLRDPSTRAQITYPPRRFSSLVSTFTAPNPAVFGPADVLLTRSAQFEIFVFQLRCQPHRTAACLYTVPPPHDFVTPCGLRTVRR